MPLHSYIIPCASYYEQYRIWCWKRKKQISKKKEIKIHLDSCYPEINISPYILPVLFYAYIQIFTQMWCVYKSRNAKGCWQAPGAWRERHMEQILSESSRNNRPCWHFDFRLVASWTMRKYMSVVLSRPVCGKLLWQPQEMNTDEVSITHRIWT